MSEARIYVLFSSSKGNSAYIKHKNDEFLIDCGASARAIEDSLKALGTSIANLNGIFLTHEHSDHIRGLGTILKHFDVPVYAPETSCDYLEQQGYERAFRPLQSGKAVALGDTALCPIPTPHDARGSVGFRILAGEEKIGYFTDIGHLSEGVLRGMAGCRRIVIESNHDIEMLKNGPYPYVLQKRILGDFGHLSNELCARLLPHLASHGTESFVLAHLSEENNRPELAFRESETALVSKGFTINTKNSDVRLAVAPPRGTVELI